MANEVFLLNQVLSPQTSRSVVIYSYNSAIRWAKMQSPFYGSHTKFFVYAAISKTDKYKL
jgi:hypothetical protein